MPSPSHFDPAELNREIARLETEAARLTIERSKAIGHVAQLKRQKRYLLLARRFRVPAASFAQFPVLALAIGPLACGVAMFVALSLMVNSWSLALGGFVSGAAGAAIMLALLMYYPPDTQLQPAIHEVQTKLADETARLADQSAAVSDLNQRLSALQDERAEWGKSEKLQRAMLLQRSWKLMRGGEWEDFVVEVCRTLGANVQRGTMPAGQVFEEVPSKGARGVIRRMPITLYVTFSPKRFAVAAVSDIHPFHAAAVRQVIDHLAQQGCDELGIITNTRLTAGSKEFARSRHCTLVGEEEFPDFVLGKCSL